MTNHGNAFALKHGYTRNGKKPPEYKAWDSMIQRCHNPKSESFKNYGGRGIAVCEAWRSSFATFIADVGPRPSPQHSLGRIKNHLGYEPGNVRWETAAQQQGNTRSNRRVTAFGQTKIMSDWARERGIPLDTLWRRLTIWKWAPERAVSEPVSGKRPELQTLVYRSGFSSVSAFLKESGLAPAVFYKLGTPGTLRPATLQRIATALGMSMRALQVAIT